MTMPVTPGGTLSEVSRTSPAFSPKMARSSFSSGESCVSPFGVILPTRMSLELHLGPDSDDARLVEVLERLFADVRDVSRDLFLAELGVASDALEFLDVDGGVDVVLGDPLGEQNRVLEVVPAPGHERDDHVLAERELTAIRARAVGDDVAGLDPVSRTNDRRLVVGGVLVGTLELVEAVDVGERAREPFGLDDDPRRIHRLDHAVLLRDDANAGVAGDPSLDAGARRWARAFERTEPPDAACSSPSRRGSRRRARGTESAKQRPKPAGSARRPSAERSSAEPSRTRR